MREHLIEAHLASREAQQPAQETVQCCMCGKKGLSTVEGDGGEECQLWDDRWTCSRACYDIAYSLAHPPQPSASVVEALRELVAACEAYPVNIPRADAALDNAHAVLRALKGEKA